MVKIILNVTLHGITPGPTKMWPCMELHQTWLWCDPAYTRPDWDVTLHRITPGPSLWCDLAWNYTRANPDVTQHEITPGSTLVRPCMELHQAWLWCDPAGITPGLTLVWLSAPGWRHKLQVTQNKIVHFILNLSPRTLLIN